MLKYQGSKCFELFIWNKVRYGLKLFTILYFGLLNEKQRRLTGKGWYDKYMTEEQFKIEPQYGPSHNFLVYCNDVLVSLIKYADRKKLSSVKIEFKNKEEETSFDILKEGSDIFDWMQEHGYSDEMYELEYRHTFFSLVADFCHYMLESFECAAKKKVAVAYALLRKPLRDNLHYIEWLAAEREDLLDKLAKDNAEDLVINSNFSLE